MNVVGTIFLFIIGVPLTLVSLIALFSALMLLFPEPIEEARANLELHPWRSIFLGFLNFAGAVVIIGLLFTVSNIVYELQGPAQGIGMLILVVLSVPLMLGLAGAIILTGNRLGQWRRPFWSNLRGGGLLLLACVTPLVGWFVFAPLLVWACIGAVVGTLKRKKAAPAAETPVELVTPAAE
jgi:hypothetical protein